MNFLDRYQVQLYLLALGVGALASFVLPVAELASELSLPFLAGLLWATFMSIPLRRQTAEQDKLSRRFICWLLGINFIAVPILAGILIALFPLTGPIAFTASLVLLAPCIDYVVVFCGLAGGDSGKLLRATPLLLGVQVLTVPMYLWIFRGLGLWEMDIPAGALENSLPSVVGALAVVLLPFLLAWALQNLPRSVGERAGNIAETAMVPLMVLVLFSTVAASFAQVAGQASELVLLAGLYALFAAITGVGMWTTTRRYPRARGQEREERVALVFSGVTRNALVILPVVLALAEVVNQPLLPFAVMTQTLVELLVMVAMVMTFRKN